MSKLIFVNLPVADVARSTAFYESIGAVKDERFCDGTHVVHGVLGDHLRDDDDARQVPAVHAEGDR